MNFAIMTVFIIPFYIAIPAIILYFVIKFAVKNAMKELKQENNL